MENYKTDNELKVLISSLREYSRVKDAPIWKAVALELERPTRQRRSVNISRINRYANDGDTVIVPGKVLGSGILDKKITIAAYNFSNGARKIVEDRKGKCVSINDLVKQNPSGKNVRVIG
ncbi:50S ribosomal protein L18e [Candidatus Woesearchaeota archaeon]|nr:50S ribosomal protein L18e [Candidatus Woesearchaeota archaeon]